MAFTYKVLRYFALISLTVLLLANARTEHSLGVAQTSPDIETITIAQFGKERFLLYLPLYIAIEEGYFQKRGLNIKLQFAGNDDQIFASVIRGDALFGIGDPAFAAIAREKGNPGKVVALLVKRLGLSGVSRKGAVERIKTPDDLKGLKISSLPSPSTTFTLLNQVLRNDSLASRGTKIIQTAIGTQIAALEAGQVDIALDLEPAISIAEGNGYEVSFLLDSFTKPQAITGLTTLEKTIESRGDLVQKVVSSIHEALVSMQKDPAVSRRVACKLFPSLPTQVIERAIGRMEKFEVFPSSSIVPDTLWQTTLQTRLEAGDLKQPQKTSFTVDNSFANRAHSELVSQ